jgi:acyl-CoA synthetase (AMP-forming)/AMP-acid ligase II
MELPDLRPSRLFAAARSALSAKPASIRAAPAPGRESITIYGADGEPAATLDFATVQDAWIGTVLGAFPDAERIGVIAPTSAEGIGFWKAVLLAGKTPIMLQYPTPKLSRTYWQREIGNAVTTLGVEAVAYWGPLADPKLSIPQMDLTAAPGARAVPPVRQFAEGRMTQLSSGTTGFRKGVGLSIADVVAHVNDYNQVLQLGPDDCIVSWLPLYHDMGFIAAFLMPMMLDVRLVLVDPVTWTRRPELLFELIERHRGTLCFMPNFGFEVMARRAKGRSDDLSSMRRWVSCSEPTRIDSMRKFTDATRVDETNLSNCYAMAENIFAVTQSTGLSTRRFGNVEAVSCGPAIPGVSMKIVDGEVWVRSPYSLRAYEGGQAIIDDEGFYPTGDVGEVVDDQLYILGRKRDVMIHAGRKIVLSDVDHEVGRLVPGSAGRIATVSSYNELLGTDDPVCLIEDDRYWRKNRETDTVAAMRSEAGLEQGRIEFVAPGFITKTSSGKINRVLTGDHWSDMRAWRTGTRKTKRGGIDGLRGEILEMFPGITPNVAFGRQLDSLGLVNISLLLGEYGIENAASLSLNTLRLSETTRDDQATGSVIKIVSMFDGDWLMNIMEPVLSTLGTRLGVSIHYEHVCCPPAPILLSDLTFEEQFAVRDGREGVYDGFSSALRAIRSADLIITDDLVQMGWPAVNDTHYPRLSHRFEAGVLSENLCVRWARYSERNHLVATELVASSDITPSSTIMAMDDIEDYLGVPILRVALTKQFSEHTLNWPVRHLKDCVSLLVRTGDPEINYDVLKQDMFAALVEKCKSIRPKEGIAQNLWHASDQPHWCSWLVNPALVDYVLDRYDSFLVLGKPGSVPYLSREADRRGKLLTFRSDLLCPSGDYECVLQTGSWGRPTTDKPVFPIMKPGWGDQPFNVPDSVRDAAPSATLHALLSDRLPAM